MKVQPDPLAAALDAATNIKPGIKSRIETLFGDRPGVLDSIRAANQRNISHQRIADTLSTKDERVSAGSVRNWLSADSLN